MAKADGSISEEECLAIVRICREQGIAPEQYEAYLFGEVPAVSEALPIDRIDRHEYLKRLIMVMGADAECSQIEIFLLEVIAGKLGVRHLELVSLVLITATRRHFHGDTGSRILSSFLKNVIDPKSMTLQQNQDNMRTILSLIVADLYRDCPDDTAEAFLHTLADAAGIVLGNRLLRREYEMMGLSLSQTVGEECRRLTIISDNNNEKNL